MGLKSYRRHSAAVIRDRRWPALRLAAKRRDGWRCVACGQRGPRLEVDHKIPVRDDPSRAFDLDNLQTLCSRCHASKTRLETGNDSHLDGDKRRWREFIKQL
ncbi:HNH endonuclease [Roseitalea porphyridii]|uniref:HNH endonuclease n=1 Tax=Roseitalea porphyridii TaxID=1852022 RepID=UPI0032EF6DD1